MQLRPRHFVLVAIIIGIFVFNIVKHRRDVKLRQVQLQGDPIAAPAWAAYDQAAALRDAPDAQFQPAFNNLRAATEGPGSDTAETSHALSDVIHCKIWLNFYRNPAWQANARKHVLGCAQYHRDTTA